MERRPITPAALGSNSHVCMLGSPYNSARVEKVTFELRVSEPEIGRHDGGEQVLLCAVLRWGLGWPATGGAQTGLHRAREASCAAPAEPPR